MHATYSADAISLLERFEAFLAEAVRRLGGPQPASRPPHRTPFEWPRRRPSARYHLHPGDWKGEAALRVDGKEYAVVFADTEFGVFGRCEAFWAEGRGASVEAMLANLAVECEPLWERQRAIGAALGLEGRCETPIPEMRPLQLLQLLYCGDRDVANDAAVQIDENASRGIWGPSLIAVMSDRGHPLRRQAQWCVLDLLEDLPGFFREAGQQRDIFEALERFLWDCEDDYARTCYKCGDVLGDHVADDRAADLLLRVLEGAPSKFGRRSAIHGLIHVTEWLPDRRPEIEAALRATVRNDPEPLLREYGEVAINDIRMGAPGIHPHGPEPVFPED